MSKNNGLLKKVQMDTVKNADKWVFEGGICKNVPRNKNIFFISAFAGI